MKFIKSCLESVFNQTVLEEKDYEIKVAVNVVDNGSEDGTVDFIKRNYPQVHVLKNINNLGFARGYNQAIKMCQADWTLVLNVDVVLDPDFLKKIFSAIKNSQDKVGSFGGKILRIETLREESGLSKVVKSNKIDSCGLEVKKSRQVKNIGEGEVDRGQYDDLSQVFGFSGACVLYRREALEDVKFREEYFDEDFFAYQEDYDLSYRLQLYGWQSTFVPGAKAYHFRSARQSANKFFEIKKIVESRRQRSRLINYHSYKNHLFVLLKNEIGENFWRHFIFIFWYELRKFVFLLLFEQETLKALGQFFKLLPRMLLKRKIIMSRRKVTAKYMRQLFSSSAALGLGTKAGN